MNPLSAIVRRLERKVGKHHLRRQLESYRSNDFTLDLGCGTSILKEIFPNRVGLDYQTHSLLDVVGDAQKLPFASDSFEQIVCSEVLEHVKNPNQSVEEMNRVLKSGGKLIFSMPFVYPLHEGPHDYQRYTEYGLKALFEPLFEVEFIKPVFSEEQTLAILLQRIAFQRQGGILCYCIYLGLSHLIFRFSKNYDDIGIQRRQGLGAEATGAFLTANYIMVAKKSHHILPY